MFVLNKLIKKINELIFKPFNDFDDSSFKSLFPDIKVLDKNNTINNVEHNLNILSTSNYNEFVRMHKDIISIYKNETLESNFAKNYEYTRNGFAKIIGNSLHDPMISEISEILIGLSKNACLVGGSVRDIIIGKTPKDFDFVTDTPYDDLVDVFKSAGFKIKETGKNFLVLNVSKNSSDFEIANFRKDGTYIDGRRPESVDIGNIMDDSARRDFTINALYYELYSGKLKDPTGLGIPDIVDKTLRFVGKPKDRLNEDSLRIWRFYRFISKGFTPNNNDLKAVRSLFAKSYPKTDPVRVMTEIEKMIKMK